MEVDLTINIEALHPIQRVFPGRFFFTHVLELSCPDAAKGISDGPKPTAAQGSGMFADVQWISSCEDSQVHDVISGNPLRRALKIRESSESGCAD